MHKLWRIKFATRQTYKTSHRWVSSFASAAWIQYEVQLDFNLRYSRIILFLLIFCLLSVVESLIVIDFVKNIKYWQMYAIFWICNYVCWNNWWIPSPTQVRYILSELLPGGCPTTHHQWCLIRAFETKFSNLKWLATLHSSLFGTDFLFHFNIDGFISVLLVLWVW